MKRIITILAVAIMSISAVSAQKYGHLNAQDLLKGMAEYKAAQTEMERYGKQKEKTLVEMQTTLQAEYKKYEVEANGLTPEIKASREKDIMELQQSIQAFQQKTQEKLQKKEVELLDPMIKKVREAIKVVGKANGYIYIFDTSAGSLLYFENGNDITELVKKELTKVVPANK